MILQHGFIDSFILNLFLRQVSCMSTCGYRKIAHVTFQVVPNSIVPGRLLNVDPAAVCDLARPTREYISHDGMKRPPASLRVESTGIYRNLSTARPLVNRRIRSRLGLTLDSPRDASAVVYGP